MVLLLIAVLGILLLHLDSKLHNSPRNEGEEAFDGR
jgi:hypothetical protein